MLPSDPVSSPEEAVKPRTTTAEEIMFHAEISPTELADRLAIRELVDEYAHCADRRLAEKQKSLFTPYAHFVIYMSGQGSEPTQVIDRRESLTPVFEDLNRYEATQHFNGQSTIELDADRATGESYCIAHHLFTEDGVRKLMVAHLRYDDTFIKERGAWLIARRNLYVDWVETRALGA
jgi:SnoaL-like domain